MDNFGSTTLIIFSILWMIFLITMVTFNIRLIKKKDNQLSDMGTTIKNLRSQLSKNRRRAVRIDIPPVDCHYKFINFGEKKLEQLLNRTGAGKMADISIKGLKLLSEYDLPISREVLLNIRFRFYGEDFEVKGMIIRKEAHVHLSQITYGVEFIEMNSSDSSRLAYILNKIQVELCKNTA